MMTKPKVSKEAVGAYTVREAAGIFDVTASTIYDWLNEGKLCETSTIGGGIKLVTAESVEAYIEQHKEEK